MSDDEVYKKTPKEEFLKFWITHQDEATWEGFTSAVSGSAVAAGYSPMESVQVSRRCGALQAQIKDAGFGVPRKPKKESTKPQSLSQVLSANRDTWEKLGLKPATPADDATTPTVKPGEPGWAAQQRKLKRSIEKDSGSS